MTDPFEKKGFPPLRERHWSKITSYAERNVRRDSTQSPSGLILEVYKVPLGQVLARAIRELTTWRPSRENGGNSAVGTVLQPLSVFDLPGPLTLAFWG
jgi:hypothetical protein